MPFIEYEAAILLDKWVDGLVEQVAAFKDSMLDVKFDMPATSCSGFQIGKFNIQADGITYLVHRTADEHVEFYEGVDEASRYLIEWTSDCTYRLHTKETSGETLGTIFSVTEDGYEFVEKNMTYDYKVKGKATTAK